MAADKASLFGLLLALTAVSAGAQPSLDVAVSGALLSRTAPRLTVTVGGATGEIPVTIAVDGQVVQEETLANGEHGITLADARLAGGDHTFEVRSGPAAVSTQAYAIPAWLSVLPPLIAITLAIVFKDVLLALFLGIFSGALCLFGWNPLTALARTVDRFIAPAITDSGQARILVFTLMLGGMVGLVTRSGGTQGIVASMSRYATNARRGQIATWLMGILIFFDDYSNSLIVGSTMRPLSDRLKISREKLAYIVDSTAAPVASIVPFSSWIGFEVGLIAAALTALELPYNAYATFIASIPFRFYPIFALVLGLTIAISGRDFGPMRKAEQRARRTGKLMDDDAVPLADYQAEQLAPPEGTPLRAINAFLPILAIIVVTLIGLYVTGRAGLDRADYPSLGEWLRQIMSNADSYKALLWASLSGVILGAALPLLQKILTLRQTMSAMVEGFKSMLLALVVLTLAWSIGAVCTELHTADFLVRLTGGFLAPQWVPALVFFLSAALAFATGSSWGTLSILMPLVIPIAHAVAGQSGWAVGSPAYTTMLVGTISSVLAGSVWGDHCSPISDTTILSSTASGCDHIAHVKTQMPYALAAGFLGVIVGDIPTAYGMSPWISLLVGTLVIVGLVRWLGKSASEPAPT
ncbi:MAG: Na+/H+ antiporter NhaC family protein [Acidobacteria bacterium]|nr:Na+/H+ antiporter NhaC family protein [Acidobacteriota bacterium]